MPFQFQPYDNSRSAATIGELMLRASQIRANQLRQIAEIQARQQTLNGATTAHMVGGIANAAAGSIGDILRYKQEAPMRAAAQQRAGQESELRGLQIQGAQQQLNEPQRAAEKAAKEAQQDQQLADLFASGRAPTAPDASTGHYVADAIQGTDAAVSAARTLSDAELSAAAYRIAGKRGQEAFKEWKATQPKPEKVGTREIKVRNADGSESIQIVADTPGFSTTSAAPVEKPPTAGSFEDWLSRAAKEKNRPVASLTTKEVAAERAAFEAAGRAPKDPTVTPTEPHLWVQRDGKIIRVAESAIQPGDTPASTREQGRPVTSGDAGRIADLDTSLNDLATLGKTISGVAGATGTAAQVGAALPNFVTNATGWGTDAKTKQAVIDRVKQVIGKALEGGVLRKEDEYKYEKILPTIGDPPAVVTAKLEGLQKAITQRRQTTLDALADANYDVSKYQARTATPADAEPREGTEGTVGGKPAVWRTVNGVKGWYAK